MIKPFSLETFIINKLSITVLHGLLVFLFLNVFKPFKLYLLKEHLFGYTILMGILTFILPFLIFVFLEKINYKKWTIGSLALLSICFLVIYNYILWFSSGIYKDITGLVKLSFLLFSKYSSSLAILSFATIFLLNDLILDFKKKKKNNQIKAQEITIYSENKKENLRVNINKLIYTSVTGNYTSFHIITEEGVKEVVLRNSLSNVLLQIKKFPTIFRCHKSYIVNTSFFNTLSGNARGYYLESELLTTQIPISRSFKKEELKKLIFNEKNY
ncbi:LytTR family transcriptional regulator DNA-binding domain-containing protein [Polaribacter staleyi]|uniref:LytTR family transcriptional regulator DNA-binding domain-containing protein n=1 Tax=Polaribacter staleyi TaxID=2022337 RepID=UPI0031BBAC46